MIYSFDIFDTCLVRKCGTPYNCFELLSKRVFVRYVEDKVRHEFILERRKAEQNAYKDTLFANIYDVYRHFAFEHPFLIAKDELAKIEIDLECDVLVPVYEIKNKIKQLRSEGSRIMFVSDMYLPASVLKQILSSNGLYMDGDAIYVSCEVGKTKHTGELFEYIHETEHIDYSDWTHYGDNAIGDYKSPKELGINAIQVTNAYTPYQTKWIMDSDATTFNYGSILAGISRSLNCIEPANQRKAFILDIIAPLYCTFVYNIFADAKSKGISRIYFMARDTYQMYQVASTLNDLFPEISIHYLRISRDAMYKGNAEARLLYFKQEGLASECDNVAVVDTTTSGRTLQTLNEELKNNGYKSVYGYYFLKYDDQDVDINIDSYSYVVRQYCVRDSVKYTNLFRFALILENYFSTNNDKRTIDYQIDNGVSVPVFCEKVGGQDSVQSRVEEWQQYHSDLLCKYANVMKELQMLEYSQVVLHNIALPTLCDFFYSPDRYYLEAFLDYKVYGKRGFVPYVKKDSLFKLYRIRGWDSGWAEGTMKYNLPDWLRDLKHLIKKIIGK